MDNALDQLCAKFDLDREQVQAFVSENNIEIDHLRVYASGREGQEEYVYHWEVVGVCCCGMSLSTDYYKECRGCNKYQLSCYDCSGECERMKVCTDEGIEYLRESEVEDIFTKFDIGDEYCEKCEAMFGYIKDEGVTSCWVCEPL